MTTSAFSASKHALVAQLTNPADRHERSSNFRNLENDLDLVLLSAPAVGLEVEGELALVRDFRAIPHQKFLATLAPWRLTQEVRVPGCVAEVQDVVACPRILCHLDDLVDPFVDW